jgi:hypothetical protein
MWPQRHDWLAARSRSAGAQLPPCSAAAMREAVAPHLHGNACIEGEGRGGRGLVLLQ